MYARRFMDWKENMNDFDILSENISNQLNMLFKQIYSKGYQDGRADVLGEQYVNNGNPDA